MLRSLYIQNYALIDQLEIDFESGFSVITGETGAGKSIILGAIGLLLGQRADVKAIRQGAKKCVIEARFQIANYDMNAFFDENLLEYDDECILRREIQSSGKSRAFINDTPVTLVQLKELGEQLIDVHSQHQNLLLNKEGFQLNVLDLLAHNMRLLGEYKSCYQTWHDTEKELNELLEDAKRSKADEDYIRFQLEQLEEANLIEGEQEQLEQEAETLEHAEEIKAGLYRAEQAFLGDENGLLNALKERYNELSSLQKVYSGASELSERIYAAWIELRDVVDEIASAGERIEYNPSRLEVVNSRLDQIYTLQQKHRVDSVVELIELLSKYAIRLDDITSFDDRIHELEQRKEAEYQRIIEQAACLSKTRREAAKVMEREMAARLMVLGMPNVRFQIEITDRVEPSINGMDSVNFLFSANKNGALQTVSSVASGGEIARVMLSIKALIAGAVKLPTIVFDEIDTGVSGEMADRMADIMEEMGERERQVISITHLPQIAARGKIHYKVYKRDSENETNSHINRLTHDERVEELAHMLSGANLTEAALANARTLLSK